MARTTQGLTPLHIAASYGRYEAVLALLRLGASPEASSLYGNTPLHLAARWGCERACAALAACGASWTTRNADGVAPNDIADRWTAVAALANETAPSAVYPASLSRFPRRLRAAALVAVAAGRAAAGRSGARTVAAALALTTPLWLGVGWTSFGPAAAGSEMEAALAAAASPPPHAWMPAVNPAFQAEVAAAARLDGLRAFADGRAARERIARASGGWAVLPPAPTGAAGPSGRSTPMAAEKAAAAAAAAAGSATSARRSVGTPGVSTAGGGGSAPSPPPAAEVGCAECVEEKKECASCVKEETDGMQDCPDCLREMESCVECVADIVGCSSCSTPHIPTSCAFPDCPPSASTVATAMSPADRAASADGVLPALASPHAPPSLLAGAAADGAAAALPPAPPAPPSAAPTTAAAAGATPRRAPTRGGGGAAGGGEGRSPVEGEGRSLSEPPAIMRAQSLPPEVLAPPPAPAAAPGAPPPPAAGARCGGAGHAHPHLHLNDVGAVLGSGCEGGAAAVRSHLSHVGGVAGGVGGAKHHEHRHRHRRSHAQHAQGRAHRSKSSTSACSRHTPQGVTQASGGSLMRLVPVVPAVPAPSRVDATAIRAAFYRRTPAGGVGVPAPAVPSGDLFSPTLRVGGSGGRFPSQQQQGGGGSSTGSALSPTLPVGPLPSTSPVLAGAVAITVGASVPLALPTPDSPPPLPVGPLGGGGALGGGGSPGHPFGLPHSPPARVQSIGAALLTGTMPGGASAPTPGAPGGSMPSLAPALLVQSAGLSAPVLSAAVAGPPPLTLSLSDPAVVDSPPFHTPHIHPTTPGTTAARSCGDGAMCYGGRGAAAAAAARRPPTCPSSASSGREQ